MSHHPDPSRKWERRSYDEEKSKGLSPRELWELETDRDMDKPIEQLVCDVHEETHSQQNWDAYSEKKWLGNIAAAQKRFASLMARVALSNDKLATQMLYLTWAIVVMTFVLVVLAVIPLCSSSK